MSDAQNNGTPEPRRSRPPLALISTRVTEEASYVEPRSALAHNYVHWFEMGGAGEDDGNAASRGWTVIPVPASTGTAESYLDLPGVELVVLTGGNNVDPQLYHGPSGVNQVYPERDRTEFALIAGALERGIPVWGVCRGLHTINVYFGGRLTQEVEGHVATEHPLTSEHALLSDKTCNSYHNQAVRGSDLSRHLRVLAHSHDGLIEALYHPTEPVAAVQWHPERQDREYDRRLLASFLAGELQR
ncbi:MAG: type 1 glutamine amidotransferase [Alkalispirochaeta sp.]